MTTRSAHPLFGPVAPPLVHVMTCNVRRPVPWSFRSADDWTLRREALAALLRSEQPSLLATQEVVTDADAVIRDALGPAYTRLGRGRDAAGAGEMCALYVNTARFSVRRWEQVALSPAPERPGSRGWGALLPRSAVIAELHDDATSRDLLVVNAHFDHLSALSRRRSGALLASRIAGRGLPAVVMGDLNAGAGSPPVRELAGGGQRDAWELARALGSPAFGTLSRYRSPRIGSRRVDHILVSRGVDVERIAVNARRYDGRWASDHLPVQAVLALREGRSAE